MPANLRTCADCTTAYALDLSACPHCGSGNTEEEGVVSRRLPLFVTVRCGTCGRGPWTVRLKAVHSGLLELPTLACASCGSQVQLPWPPEEESMSPKISVHGGATNARETDLSPAVDASQPQDVAEDVLGHPTLDVVQYETAEEVAATPEVTPAADYDSMTLAELRDAASARDLPTYGTKAQLTERLREADVD